MLNYQIQTLDVPESLRQMVHSSLPREQAGKDPRMTYTINLLCPGSNSLQLARSKWALVFRSEKEIDMFIQELERGSERQYALQIEEYTVFSNVMFVFLRRQYKLCIWTQHVQDVVINKPLAVFSFQERLRFLVELVEKKISVRFQIDWKHEMIPRRYVRKLNNEDQSDSSLNQRNYQPPPRTANQYNLRRNDDFNNKQRIYHYDDYEREFEDAPIVKKIMTSQEQPPNKESQNDMLPQDTEILLRKFCQKLLNQMQSLQEFIQDFMQLGQNNQPLQKEK